MSPDPNEVTPRRGLRLWLFACAFLLFALGAHGYIDNPDAEVEYQTARAIARRGHPGLSAAHPDASVAEAYIARNELNARVGAGQDGAHPEQRVVYSWFGIGHALAMVPFYAVGAGLAALFPDVQAHAAEAWADDPGNAWRFGTRDEFWPRFVVSLHSPLFAAASLVVLLGLLVRLGFSQRTALLGTLLAALSTQFWPETRESMSDTTAGFFLLLAFERCLAWRHEGRTAALWIAGASGGFAVLCRVFHVLPLFVLGVYVLVFALRERRLAGLWIFALAALPFGVFLLVFNYARFDSMFELGYSGGTAHGYWSFPFWHGFVLLGWSAGKGVFWFSPLLWLAPLALVTLGRRRPAEVLVATSLLLLPWLLNSFTTGWHSSQAWAVRYLTLGAFVLAGLTAAELLRLARERGRRPWLLLVVAGIGIVHQLGGLLVPYRAYYELALPASKARWPEVPEGHLIHYLADSPRMSPLFVNWLWLREELRGTLGTRDPQQGREVYARLFGTPVRAPARPSWPEDHDLGHLWPLGVARRLDSSVPLFAALLLVLALGAAGRGLLLQVPTGGSEECR